MKRLLLLAFLLFGTSIAQAQLDIVQVRPLFQHLQKGEFREAWDLSDSLLTTAMEDGDDADDMPLIGIVRYIRLHAGADLVSRGEITYDDLRPVAAEMEGRFILMPGHPTQVDSSEDSTGEAGGLVAFNTNTVNVGEDSIVVNTTTTNADQTVIYAFEYVRLDDDAEVGDLHGKPTRCGGILSRVVLNPNESNIWIMRLYVEEGRIQEM